MSEVENLIYQYEGHQREVMLCLHRLFVSELNLMDKVRFKIPFYFGRSWICYLNPKKDGKTELAFVRGNELWNGQGLLQNQDRKQVWGIAFEQVSDIPFAALNEIIQEAILLDEVKPYASKRKTGK